MACRGKIQSALTEVQKRPEFDKGKRIDLGRFYMSEFNELLKTWRHTLHRHPETAFEEVKTAAFVADRLREMGIEVETGIGGTGVIGRLKAGTSPKVVALRADMDAIPLQEVGEPPYKSECDGRMHACGHDGHVTTLLGAAKLLSESRKFDGTVLFLFQPAEEPGKGARAMIEDGLFERFPMDEIYGQHNTPVYPAGTVNICKGGFASSEDNFKIEIHGRGGHASAPERTVDPLVIAAQIILALQTIPSRNAGAFQPAVVSCTELFTDGAHNAIPSNVTILGDCRSYDKETQALIERRMRDITEGICKANGAACDFLYTHEFAPTVNWDAQVDAVVHAAAHVVGEKNVNSNCTPFSASEDFGAFLETVPGAFFLLGNAVGDENRDFPLHNANFDYNDEILEVGAKVFEQIIMERLPISDSHNA